MIIVGYSKRHFTDKEGKEVVYYRISYLDPVSSKNPDANGYDANYFTLGLAKFANLARTIDDAVVGGCQVKILYNRFGKVESVEI